MSLRKSLLLLGALTLMAACDEPKSKAYDGPHGVGALVDNPDVESWPTCSDGAKRPDCSFAPEGY